MIPTAVLVTRGDVDLMPILESLPKSWPVLIWDNSQRANMKVFGHFAALPEVKTEYVYVQDDDAICPAAELLAAWERWARRGKRRPFTETYLYNEKEGETPWISWGGIFHRDLPAAAIDRWLGRYGWGDDLLLWCDLIFGCLTPHVNVDLGWEDLPYCRAANRMVVQPGHYSEQARIREMCADL